MPCRIPSSSIVPCNSDPTSGTLGVGSMAVRPRCHIHKIGQVEAAVLLSACREAAFKWLSANRIRWMRGYKKLKTVWLAIYLLTKGSARPPKHGGLSCQCTFEASPRPTPRPQLCAGTTPPTQRLRPSSASTSNRQCLTETWYSWDFSTLDHTIQDVVVAHFKNQGV